MIWSPIVNTGFSDVIGFLEDHRNVVAPNGTNGAPPGIEPDQIGEGAVSRVEDFAGLDPPGRLDEPHDGTGGDGLAASAFADHAERFLGRNGEADAIDRTPDAIFRVEVGPELLDLDQRLRSWH